MSAAVERLVEALRAAGCEPRQVPRGVRGLGWKARCPGHDDRHPSLDVDEGGDGRALLKCRAGCGFDAIVEALGMTASDLFSDGGSNGAVASRRGSAGAPRAATPAAELTFTLGRDRRRPKGERRRARDLAELAKALEAHDGPEAWWAAGDFGASYRTGETWRGSSLVACDLDFQAAGGDRAALPEDLARAVADSEPPAGAWHLTPRGLRLIVELEHQVTDAERWRAVADDVVSDVTTWLDEHGLAPRAGAGGLAVDRDACRDPAKQFWAPRAKVDGRQRGAAVHVTGRAPRKLSGDTSPLAWRDMPAEWLDSPPPRRRWLVKLPTSDGLDAAPGFGDGLLPLGKAGILCSAGGVGKTLCLLQLAVSIATGRRWLGHFHIAASDARGRVCLLLAEEDEDEARRRLWNIARALDLSPAEREAVRSRVVILPCAGRSVHLMRGTPAGVELTPLFDELRGKLAEHGDPEHGWSLIGVDPFARIGAGGLEADNDLSTQAVTALERLALEAPGRPTLLAAAHSSKLSRREGTVDVRGVTAAFDACRWVAGLVVEGDAVRFEVMKTNYGPPVEPVVLIRGRSGVLRAASEDELGARDDAAEDAKREKRRRQLESDVEAVVEAVEALGESAKKKDSIAASAGVPVWRGRAAIDAAVAAGRLVVEGDTASRIYRLTTLATTGDKLTTCRKPSRDDSDVGMSLSSRARGGDGETTDRERLSVDGGLETRQSSPEPRAREAAGGEP